MKNKTEKNPNFLEYVYKLNGDIKLIDALELSHQNIDTIDIHHFNVIRERYLPLDENRST